ncbi:MAG: tyrosine-type recombinase/integrase [Victivallaceae bacterium]|nr:tyrosine-type recombinase/integrase [Victivallaceae bacterium]
MAKKGTAKGKGYIFKRGKIFYLQYDVNGKRFVQSLKTKIEKEAQDKAKEILEPALAADTKEKVMFNVASARKLLARKSIKLSKAWELFLETSTRPDSGPATLKSYKSFFLRFQKWLAKNYPIIQDLGKITEEIAIEYADSVWAQGVSGTTFNNHMQAVKLIFKHLQKKAGLDENPFHSIGRKVEHKLSRKEFSEAQVLKILNSFKNPKLVLKDKEEMEVLFHLGAWTGLRLIDCVLMKWENVNLERNIIFCEPHKTKRVKRTVNVPIHPLLREQLNKALEWNNAEYVMPKLAHRYLGPSSPISSEAATVFKFIGLEVSKEAKKGLRRKKKTNVYGFHSFRHSFVSFCAKAGVPMPVVQSIVGHGNPAVTRHYVHIGEGAARQAINALPQGNTSGKTDHQKLKIISDILNSKSILTESDKRILETLSN